MELNGALFSSNFTWLFGGLYAFALVVALRLAPWRRLLDSEQLHVFLGTVVCLILLWHIRATVNPGLDFHLLGVTVVTLMLGWSFGVIATSLALVGVIVNAGGGWDAFVLNAVTTGVVPVTLTQVLLVLIRSFLPKHFFVYVLGNGFFPLMFLPEAMVNGWLTVIMIAFRPQWVWSFSDEQYIKGK